MKLINEIIDILSSETPNLENALIKTKVLAHKLGEKTLITWVNNELNGYNKKDNIPKYRTISTRVYGNATNGFGKYWNNHQLPIKHLNKKIQKILSEVIFDESISVIESHSKSKDMLSKPIPTEFCPNLSKGLSNGIFVESAYQQIHPTQIKSVITNIRSRLLDFILELSDKFQEEISDKDIREKSKDIEVEKLFQNAIFGNNNTIIVGNNSNINNNQNINNFDDLVKILQSYDINFHDIKDLENSIKEDNKNINEKSQKIGKNVTDWIKKIATKTSDKLAIDAIRDAIESYIGSMI